MLTPVSMRLAGIPFILIHISMHKRTPQDGLALGQIFSQYPGDDTRKSTRKAQNTVSTLYIFCCCRAPSPPGICAR